MASDFVFQEGGIQKLFDLCREDILDVLRAQALRAIATLCCVSKSILELEEVWKIITSYLHEMVHCLAKRWLH